MLGKTREKSPPPQVYSALDAYDTTPKLKLETGGDHSPVRSDPQPSRLMVQAKEGATSSRNPSLQSHTPSNYESEDEVKVYKAASKNLKNFQIKAFYVEESVKILQNIIEKADPILSELVSKVKLFERYIKNRLSNLDDPEQSNLLLAFNTEGEIESM